MIAYEELVTALTNWRARQGFATGPSDFLGPPPAYLGTTAAAPALEGEEIASDVLLDDVEGGYDYDATAEQAGAVPQLEPEYGTGDYADYGQPAEDYAQPAGDYAQPAEGYAQPVEDYAQPAEDYAQAVEDYAQAVDAPAGDYSQPADEYGQPAAYGDAPADDFGEPIAFEEAAELDYGSAAPQADDYAEDAPTSIAGGAGDAYEMDDEATVIGGAPPREDPTMEVDLSDDSIISETAADSTEPMDLVDDVGQPPPLAPPPPESDVPHVDVDLDVLSEEPDPDRRE